MKTIVRGYAFMLVLAVVGVSSGWGMDLLDFEGEDYEVPAGALAFAELNPIESVYGLGYGDQTWLKETPVLGEYFLTLFYNDLESMLYLGLGLSLRIQPHWRVAPFIGGGGSFNLALGGSSTEPATDEAESGESYGAGHVEAGVQWEAGGRMYELLARWVTTSSDVPDSDYGLIRLGYGLRF